MDNILKIIPQAHEHEEAEIIGDTMALTALRDAINKALDAETSIIVFQTMQSDGEGYEVRVQKINDMERLGSEYFRERGY